MSGTTTSRALPLVIYDGACDMCVGWVRRMVVFLGGVPMEYRSYRRQGALRDVPGLTADQCAEAIHFVDEAGRITRGAEAIVQILGRRPLGRVAHAYYVPGLRHAADELYAAVARARRCKLPEREEP